MPFLIVMLPQLGRIRGGGNGTISWPDGPETGTKLGEAGVTDDGCKGLSFRCSQAI